MRIADLHGADGSAIDFGDEVIAHIGIVAQFILPIIGRLLSR